MVAGVRNTGPQPIAPAGGLACKCDALRLPTCLRFGLAALRIQRGIGVCVAAMAVMFQGAGRGRSEGARGYLRVWTTADAMGISLADLNVPWFKTLTHPCVGVVHGFYPLVAWDC